jgi:(p)ppGpp synthase/HD superfamily hydrolase
MNLQRAIEIAVEAHKGQLDKAGNLYVLHPLRVMMSLDTEDEKIVGVLHDVVEDCEGWTWERLQDNGFSKQVIDGLKSVSKTPIEEADYRRRLETQDHEGAREHYLAFIARAGANEIGRNVKVADLRDNLDISRLKEITESDRQRLNRYKEALAVLKDG